MFCVTVCLGFAYVEGGPFSETENTLQLREPDLKHITTPWQLEREMLQLIYYAAKFPLTK